MSTSPVTFLELARRAVGMSSADLAAATGFSATFTSGVETGREKPSPKFRAAVVAVLAPKLEEVLFPQPPTPRPGRNQGMTANLGYAEALEAAQEIANAIAPEEWSTGKADYLEEVEDLIGIVGAAKVIELYEAARPIPDEAVLAEA